MGRYIIHKIQTDDSSSIAACNLYAHNCDNPEFFNQLYEEIIRLQATYVVIGGDWNLTLNEVLDRKSGREPHIQAQKAVKAIMHAENLVDVWRDSHDKDRVFSWVKNVACHAAWSRIDFFLVSKGLATRTTRADIHPSLCSDHSVVTIELALNENTRGPGIWKLNNNLLQNKKYVSEVSTTYR